MERARSRYPRRKCCGLIEVESLRRRQRVRDRRYPRRKCCGLIEVVKDRITKVESSCYPRRKCCGLIEVGLMRHGGDAFFAVIRGANAAASLKFDNEFDEFARAAGYPRRKCCGLIEVVGRVGEGNLPEQLSAAQMLRPH